MSGFHCEPRPLAVLSWPALELSQPAFRENSPSLCLELKLFALLFPVRADITSSSERSDFLIWRGGKRCSWVLIHWPAVVLWMGLKHIILIGVLHQEWCLVLSCITFTPRLCSQPIVDGAVRWRQEAPLRLAFWLSNFEGFASVGSDKSPAVSKLQFVRLLQDRRWEAFALTADRRAAIDTRVHVSANRRRFNCNFMTFYSMFPSSCSSSSSVNFICGLWGAVKEEGCALLIKKEKKSERWCVCLFADIKPGLFN